ncbi:MAG TPA: hypothetical protein VL860_12955 [Planctomycetota bacterium]|nr:hypothetical protein [Planctomycetota bacterium]
MLKRTLSVIALSALLLLAGGCTDDQARKEIDLLTNDNQKKAAQIAELESQIKSMQKSVNYDELIENKVNAKMAAMAEDTRKKGETDTKSISDFVESSRKSIDEMSEATHAQVGDKDKPGVIEEHLQNRIAQQAENEKAEREKMKADILRYIDSQLKDMYPYAFKKQKANETHKVSDQVDLP